MNYLDLIIIYLACGSPFGVYYLINNYSTKKLVPFKSFFIIVFWVAYALILLHKQVKLLLTYDNFEKDNFLDSKKTKKLKKIQNIFEMEIKDTSNSFSLFETREIFERYLGLSSLVLKNPDLIKKEKFEIFQITNNKSPDISSNCLNRRNYDKLVFHHKKARNDFIQLIQFFLNQSSRQKKLGNFALGFVKILDDSEAEELIKTLLYKIQQTSTTSPVQELEKFYGKS